MLLAVVVLVNLPAPTALRLRRGARETVAPFQNVASALVDRLTAGWRMLARAGEEEDRLRRLEEELVGVRLEARRWKTMAAETEQMRRLLDFRQERRDRLVLCRVVARGEISGWWQTVRLDRGEEAGIGTDMAVITSDGVVGKTTAAAHGFADVLLLTDPNCRISCRIPQSGGFGILRGTGVSEFGGSRPELVCAPGPCALDFVARGDTIREGYEVVTSGLGGVYPEGLLIGFVARADVEPTGLYQRAEVLPAARLDRLRYVFVVTGPNAEDTPP